MKTIKDSIICSFLSFLIGSCGTNQKQVDLLSSLDRQIDSMRIVYNFPAVAYGVIRNDSILAVNALGYRDIETKERVEPTDYFHIGSCTKSFTAFLAAKIIEEGLLDWDTEFFDLFPELKSESNPAYHHITLQQLLSHRARLISFKEDSEVFPLIAQYEEHLAENTPIAKKRYYCVSHILKSESQNSDLPLSELYSNAGFMAGGLMLEKVTNKTWEKLIQNMSDELDLGIQIGWPVDFTPDQPKGHIDPKEWTLDIEKDLVPISDQMRKFHFVNQFILLTTPSGNISITVKGFLEYARLILSGLNGIDNYLKAETYETLFKSYPEYSHGWWVEGSNENRIYSHRGSNGTFYSFVGIMPKSNLGIVIMINTHEEAGLTDMIQLLNDNFSI